MMRVVEAMSTAIIEFVSEGTPILLDQGSNALYGAVEWIDQHLSNANHLSLH
jgi:hypothetical protein